MKKFREIPVQSAGLLIFLMFAGVISAQTFTVEKVAGDVKYQNGSSENWFR